MSFSIFCVLLISHRLLKYIQSCIKTVTMLKFNYQLISKAPLTTWNTVLSVETQTPVNIKIVFVTIGHKQFREVQKVKGGETGGTYKSEWAQAISNVQPHSPLGLFYVSFINQIKNSTAVITLSLEPLSPFERSSPALITAKYLITYMRCPSQSWAFAYLVPGGISIWGAWKVWLCWRTYVTKGRLWGFKAWHHPQFVLFAYNLRYSAPATISAALLAIKLLFALDS